MGPTDQSPLRRAIAPGEVTLAILATSRPLQSPLTGLWKAGDFIPGLRPPPAAEACARGYWKSPSGLSKAGCHGQIVF